MVSSVWNFSILSYSFCRFVVLSFCRCVVLSFYCFFFSVVFCAFANEFFFCAHLLLVHSQQAEHQLQEPSWLPVHVQSRAVPSLRGPLDRIVTFNVKFLEKEKEFSVNKQKWWGDRELENTHVPLASFEWKESGEQWPWHHRCNCEKNKNKQASQLSEIKADKIFVIDCIGVEIIITADNY